MNDIQSGVGHGRLPCRQHADWPSLPCGAAERMLRILWDGPRFLDNRI